MSVAAELELSSRALWRGLALTDGAVAEPSAIVEAYGLAAELDATIAFDGARSHAGATAIASSILYAREWRSLRVEPSVALHRFAPTSAPSTTVEAALEVSISVGKSRLFTAQAIDVATHPGAWFGVVGAELVASRERWSLTARGDVGFANTAFNSAYFRIAELDPDVVEGRLSARRTFDDEAYVDAHFDVSTLIAPTLRGAVSAPTLWALGLAIGFER